MTAASVAGTLLFSAALVFPMEMDGIALASSLAFTFSSGVGVALLRRAMSAPLRLFSGGWLAKIAAACAATAAVGLAWRALWRYPAEASLLWRGVWLVGIAAACAAVYGVATLKLKCEEWNLISQALRRKAPPER